jgi:hypothetical protein
LLLALVICLVAATVVVIFAVRSTGNPARHVDLNDGGVWATNNSLNLFGHFNKPAAQLQGGFLSPGGSVSNANLDVAQSGNLAVAWDRGKGQMLPINPFTGRPGTAAVGIPSTYQLAIGGRSGAVLDPATGKLWAAVIGTDDGMADLSRLDAQNKPLVTVGKDAALTVGLDGTVYALSGATGLLITLSVDGDHLGPPQRAKLGRTFRGPELTVVGDQIAILDTASRQLVLPDHQTVSLAGDGPSLGAKPVLQQPGSAAGAVYVETSSALLAVSLSDASVQAVFRQDHLGTPAAPVNLDGCVHGLWGGSPAGAYLRSCGSTVDPLVRFQPGRDHLSTTQPVFRVNWHQIIVNDLQSGALYLLTPDVVESSNWQALVPKIVHQKDTDKQDTDDTSATRNVAPKANPDHLGARPGRTNVLHVLDNDSNPAGGIVAISSVSPSTVQGAKLTIAPDGQTILMAIPADARVADRSFTYTIDNGNGKTSNAATVTVSQRRDRAENGAPAVRKGAKPLREATTAGATVQYPVLGDWRDRDSDPIVITSATVQGGSVSFTADGRLVVTTPASATQAEVHFQLTDGYGGQGTGVLTLTLQDPRGQGVSKPVAEPDVVRGSVGTALRIEPLANDLPGADPEDPNAALTLAGNASVDSGNAQVTTDQTNGVLTFLASAPGTYRVTYRVAFGASVAVTGTVRVDIDATNQTGIIATPDAGIVRGQQPTTVDVLANDFDIGGGAMVVTRALAANQAANVEVAVIEGRWLRVSAVTPNLSAPVIIRYTVTDGAEGESTGELTVTQLPPATHDTPPIPQDDAARVRADDSVSVAVLDNDTDPDGDPVSLAKVPLTVTPAIGTAEVFGSQVRYVAPASVKTETTVRIDYVVSDPAMAQATGHLVVVIEPAPHGDNAAPTPKLVTKSVISGDTMNIAVPVAGVDPDGDTVTVIGIDSPPSLGRIRGIGANSILYQAYPDRSGTDSFTYVVQDRYGAVGRAAVRLAITPPGQPQPPVAVDDVITAAPGAQVNVAVTSNDYVAPGDRFSVALAHGNGPRPHGTSLDDDGVLHTTAPADGALVLAYDLADGTGEPSRGQITIRVQPGYNNPPEVKDDSAKPPKDGGDQVTVDVLANDNDPDGSVDALELVSVAGANPGTVIDDGKVLVTLGDYPRTVSYVVRDANRPAGKGIGLIHLPARSSDRPTIKPDVSAVVLKQGETRDIDIRDYVTDPTDAGIKLTTTDRIWASPTDGLSANSRSTTVLRLSALGSYVGPAAVTFEVTDGEPDDAVVLTMPVRIGPVAPVIRCPDDTIQLVEGGQEQKLDITGVCHVWTDDPEQLDQVEFSYAWSQRISGVNLRQGGTGNRLLTLTATADARPGKTGTVEVRAAKAKSSLLHVRIVPAPPATLRPITVEGVNAGRPRSIDVTPYVRTRIADPNIQVVAVYPRDPVDAKHSFSGSTITITPDADSHGTMVFDVRVTDVAGHNDRMMDGVLTLGVRGHPDVPGNPRALSSASRSAVLSFSSPAPNGAPILRFEVVDNHGGHYTCASSPCTVTGLTNGTAYSFRVRAVNAVGRSELSLPSNQVVPDIIPNAPVAVVAKPGDQSAVVTWQAPPPNGGTAIRRYYVQISPNPGTSSARQTIGPGVRRATFTGLANGTAYTFRVAAVNGKGQGPWSAGAPATPFGTPAAPAQPAVSTVQNADQSSQSLRVTWAAPDGNGRPIVGYTVRVYIDGAVAATVPTTQPEYTRNVGNDGRQYTFDVTATNGGQKTSAPSPKSAPVTASGIPAQMAAPTAKATGQDGQVRLTFTAPAAHGATISHYVATDNHGGSRTCAGSPCTVTGLTDGASYTFKVHAVNARGSGPPSPPSAAVTPYGPPPTPVATATRVGAHSPNIDFSWRTGPSNGLPLTCVVRIDGAVVSRSCGSGSTTRNEGYGQTGRITVTVTDSKGTSRSASDSAQAGTEQNPTVTLERGEQRTCSNGHTTCHVVIVIVHDFQANHTYNVHFQGEVAPWDSGGRSFTDTTDGNGYFRHVTDQWYANDGTYINVDIGGKTYRCIWP